MTNAQYFLTSTLKITLLAGLLTPVACESPPEADNPNVIIILADDLGYGDLGVYNANSLVPTPNLDRLAGEGIRLTRAYCPVAVCSPSRYGLMTGRYSWRSWKKSGVMANYEPSMIEPGLLTLPAMFQAAGYTTAGFGKWHLGTSFPTLDGEPPAGYGKFRADDNGANLDLSKPVSDGPLDHGFTHWYGFSCASECWILDDKQIAAAIGHDLYTIESTPNKEHIEIIPLAQYLPVISEKTQDFLREKAASTSGQPFFLYFAPYVPHIPLAVSQEFRGKTEAGLYGDYVHELDHYIGKVLNTLEELNLKENTVVIFASDNGSQFEVTSKALDLTQATNSPADVVSQQDAGRGHHPNEPLRGTKWSIYEGGVRTPFIARWPGHFPPAQTSKQLIGLPDILATLAAIIDYDLPEANRMDSHNFLSLLTGAEKEGTREEIVVQSSGRLYGLVRDQWKYIGLGNYEPPHPEAPAGELYDLSNDESETTNLYEQYPEVVQEMKKKLEDIMGENVPQNE